MRGRLGPGDAFGTFHSPLTFSARETWLCLRGGAMIGSIWQAEQRDRILSDWEDNVFGIHLSREEKQRRTKPVQLSLRPWART
jgi:hypothetical protein